MVMEKNYYETLGVNEEASPEEIKARYKELAKAWHPDTKRDEKEKIEAEAKFKDINEAFSILSDSNKRSKYDQMRKYGNFNEFAGFEDVFGFSENSFFNDIFNNMGRGNPERRTVNLDIVLEYTLSPRDTLKSFKNIINFDVEEFCDECSGVGGESITCNICSGQGMVATRRGPVVIQQTCPSCMGSGKKFTKKCKKCHGNGYYVKKEKIEIEVPKGAPGHVITFEGKGHHRHPNIPSGKLVINFTVGNTDKFNVSKYRNKDIETNLSIDPVMGLIGGESEIESITGDKLIVKIPKGTSIGDRLRLKKEGILHIGRSERTDLIIIIGYNMPVLNDHQTDILKEYLKTLGK